jgi:hypothetical protein
MTQRPAEHALFDSLVGWARLDVPKAGAEYQLLLLICETLIPERQFVRCTKKVFKMQRQMAQ